jgi:hypothetical protein
MQIMDASVTALEGGLQGRLFGERHGIGDGLPSLVKRVAKSERRGILVLAVLRKGDSKIMVWRLGLVAAAGPRNRVVFRRFFSATLRFCTSSGDAYMCLYPLEGAVVVTFLTSSFG